jgi:SAM-dependent methyltransferase
MCREGEQVPLEPDNQRRLRQAQAELLFSLSPLKREKFRVLDELLPTSRDTLRALDVGSDNGVISHMLRLKGGLWSSVDLSEHTVELIKGLVGDDAQRTDGKTLEYPDASFDVVVIVDLLEHIETDAAFIAEVQRVLMPGGICIINVPNPTEGLLRKLRFALGQTDARHGHLRPGYSSNELRALCGKGFEFEAEKRYVGLFASVIDMLIGVGLALKKQGQGGVKGKVVDSATLGADKSSVGVLKLIKPVFALALLLDKLLPLMRGQMLAMKFRRLP